MTRYAARRVEVAGGCVAIAARARSRTGSTDDFVIGVMMYA